MNRLEPPFRNRDGTLFIEGVSATALTKRYDTPVYVYSASRIADNFRTISGAFRQAYPSFRAYYSVKANDNLAILALLQKLGAGADCSSPGEVFLARRAGIRDIIYSGIYYRDDEIAYGVRQGAIMNLDNPAKLPALKRLGYRKAVCFRVNPGIGKGKYRQITTGGKTKFGIVTEEIEAAYRRAKAMGFRRFGIHAMVGSGNLDPAHFHRVASRLVDIAGMISTRVGITFEFINVGGGFGIPYEPGERPLPIDEVALGVARVVKEKCRAYGLGTPMLAIEPGRYIVGDAGVLLARVTAIKEEPKRYVGVDAGMQTLLRPMLYGAYHPIVLASRRSRGLLIRQTIVGPICESTDVLAEGRLLPVLRKGDLLAVLNAGAYGFSMSSTYGARPRPAEVLVRGSRHACVRARQHVTELAEHTMVPSWI